MEMVWPNDVFERTATDSDESLRPFRCVLLMPFAQGRFETLAREVEDSVRKITRDLLPMTQDIAIEVDDYSTAIDISQLPKWLSPGRIRFQAHMAWICIRRISVSQPSEVPSQDT